MGRSLIQVLLVVVAALLASCEPAATPVAVVATGIATIDPQATLPPPLRYGITDDAAAAVDDLARLRERALVEIIAGDSSNIDTTNYDILVSYGRTDEPGWRSSPQSHELLLLLNTNLAPLDNPTIQETLLQSVNPVALVEASGINGAQPASQQTLSTAQIRTRLANAGYPDGFRLTIAHTPQVPLAALIDQLNAANIDTQTRSIDAAQVDEIQQTDGSHLIIALAASETQRTTWTTNAAAWQVKTLYTLPLRYYLQQDIAIIFTDNGFPLPSP